MRNSLSLLTGQPNKIFASRGTLASRYKAGGVIPRYILDARTPRYFSEAIRQDELTDIVTHTRASGATYLDSTGTLQTAASGEIRDQAYTYVDGVLTGPYIQLESAAATNLLLNSDTLSTQSVTVTAAPHTLHFTGTGTVTLSGVSTDGPLVGTGTGENNRAYLTFTPTAGTLTLTVSGTVSNAQLEAAPTPSSYIPTSGSTATRAAETLTIDTPPWPATVEATGTELVTNGTFDTDTSGWTDSSTGTGSIIWNASGYLDLNSTDSDNRGIASQSFSTVVGETYVITSSQVGGPSGLFRVGTSVGGSQNLSQSQATGDYVNTFVATATTTYVTIYGNPSGTTSYDNISVKEITPRGLAIAMDGLVTYADTGAIYEGVFFGWNGVDTTNSIFVSLDASSVNVGRIQFRQYSQSVLDLVVTGPEAYSPGINVPFSIASRHGDNFINGAVGGTALTADLTPTILPDLSATPIQIGSIFNGFIDTLRIWNVDIGDTGIEEASQ